MTKGREEQIKLRASYLNSLAVAIAAIGGFAPRGAAVLRPDEGAGRSVLLALICLAMSYVLHAVGRRLLKGLDE